jgi:hypothetical protein
VLNKEDGLGTLGKDQGQRCETYIFQGEAQAITD